MSAKDQIDPKNCDPAALAETKVLPRFRELGPGEIIQATDECFDHGEGPWSKVNPWSVGKEWNDSDFHRMRRPIDPVPHTKGHPSTIEAAAMLAKVIDAAPEGSSPKAPAAGNDCGITYSEGVRRIGNLLQEFRDAKHDTGERTVSLTRDEFDAFRQAFYAIKSPFPSKLESAQVSSLIDAVTKAQAVMTEYLKPDSPTTPKQAIQKLLDILDAPALVQALKGGQS